MWSPFSLTLSTGIGILCWLELVLSHDWHFCCSLLGRILNLITKSDRKSLGSTFWRFIDLVDWLLGLENIKQILPPRKYALAWSILEPPNANSHIGIFPNSTFFNALKLFDKQDFSSTNWIIIFIKLKNCIYYLFITFCLTKIYHSY